MKVNCLVNYLHGINQLKILVDINYFGPGLNGYVAITKCIIFPQTALWIKSIA